MTLMSHALLLFSSFLIDAFRVIQNAALYRLSQHTHVPEMGCWSPDSGLIMSEFLYKLSLNLVMIHLHGQMESSDELIPFSRVSSDGFTQPRITSCRIRLGYKHAINANSIIIISTLIKVFLNFLIDLLNRFHKNKDFAEFILVLGKTE